MKEKGKCCFIGCERDVEFEIFGPSGAPDDYTYSCEEHVGQLLGVTTDIESPN